MLHTLYIFKRDNCTDCRILDQFKEFSLKPIKAVPYFDIIELHSDDILAKKWNVKGVPTLIYAQSGEPILRLGTGERLSKLQVDEFVTSVMEARGNA